MTEKEKLILAIEHIDSLTDLLSENEYRSFFYSQLLPVFYELKRQLTNLSHSSKIKE